MMRRREFITLLGGAAAWPVVGLAQQKTSRLGYFSPSRLNPELYQVLIDALRDLGWVEGRNLAIERRFAEDRLDRLPSLAAELVGLNLDVIVATGTLAPLAAKRATSTIPIVMAASGDPLGTGLVQNLARPEGNVTGLSLMVPDIGGKWLELLKELMPYVSRVAVLWNAANPYSANAYRETESAARVLGISLESLKIERPDDFDSAFESAKRQQLDALVTIADPLTVNRRQQIVDFADSDRLAAMYGLKEFTVAGGLISYGPSLSDLTRRAAGLTSC